MRILAFSIVLAAATSGQATTAWEKSKQCSEQAAKVVADLERRLPEGQYYTWLNHYSPKQDRCFITLRLMLKLAVPNALRSDFIYSGSAELITDMQDAFERRTVASIERPDVDWNSLRAGAATHKADPARTITQRLSGGKKVQWELPSIDQQIARQIKLLRMVDPDAPRRRCIVEDQDVDCDAAAAFIADRMSN